MDLKMLCKRDPGVFLPICLWCWGGKLLNGGQGRLEIQGGQSRSDVTVHRLVDKASRPCMRDVSA
jgi:hypothetical protein